MLMRAKTTRGKRTKAKYLELQHDMDALQKQVTQSPAGEHGGKAGGKAQQQQGPSAWSNGWKKLGRLAKMTGAEAAGPGGGHGHAAAQRGAARKEQRRWRNSIS